MKTPTVPRNIPGGKTAGTPRNPSTKNVIPTSYVTDWQLPPDEAEASDHWWDYLEWKHLLGGAFLAGVLFSVVWVFKS